MQIRVKVSLVFLIIPIRLLTFFWLTSPLYYEQILSPLRGPMIEVVGLTPDMYV